MTSCRALSILPTRNHLFTELLEHIGDAEHQESRCMECWVIKPTAIRHIKKNIIGLIGLMRDLIYYPIHFPKPLCCVHTKHVESRFMKTREWIFIKLFSVVAGESYRAVWAYGWCCVELYIWYCYEPKHEGVWCSDACGSSTTSIK